uniref:Uncharacterized protein n=1 Tax=Zea mays TaxID=4577 RepID=A0A804RK80_MAIZE
MMLLMWPTKSASSKVTASGICCALFPCETRVFVAMAQWLHDHVLCTLTNLISSKSQVVLINTWILSLIRIGLVFGSHISLYWVGVLISPFFALGWSLEIGTRPDSCWSIVYGSAFIMRAAAHGNWLRQLCMQFSRSVP